MFEFLVDRFAAEGQRDAAVHTPSAVARLLTEVAAPEPGAGVLDPCCGSGEFLVGAAKYLGDQGPLTGHAFSERSASLARMNLWLHGVPAEVDSAASTFPAEKRFRVVLTNPPFGMTAPTSWRELSDRHGWLPTTRSEFLWLQYVVSSIEEDGRAAVVMPGSSLFREGSGKKIRARMVDDGIVEAIVALPPQLFASTTIAVCVWFLNRARRRRAGEILLIDAQELGHMISRTQRTLSEEDRSRLVDTITRWRDGNGYEDVRGFSVSVTAERIRQQDYVLTPGRYVGTNVAPAPASVGELLDELARLEFRAGEADAAAERQLDRIQAWIR